jgi:hypothetical protein
VAGSRRRTLGVGIGSLACAGVVTAVVLASAGSVADWPIYHRDTGHSGLAVGTTLSASQAATMAPVTPVSSVSFDIPSLGNPPETTITSPLSKSVLHFPNNVRQVFTMPIAGTAVDSGGSLPGIAQVRVSIKNIEHSEYYCGPGGCPGGPTHVWTTKFVSILATLASPGAISTSWTSSFLAHGHPHNYAITTWAIDRNGERGPTNANVHPICVRDAKSGCYSRGADRCAPDSSCDVRMPVSHRS